MPHLTMSSPAHNMSTILKTKYILFDPSHIRNVHDLDMYHQELLSYIKKGFIIKVRTSCTRVSENDNEEHVSRDIFNNIGYFTSTPRNTFENSE